MRREWVGNIAMVFALVTTQACASGFVMGRSRLATLVRGEGSGGVNALTASDCRTLNQLVAGHQYAVHGRTTTMPATFSKLERDSTKSYRLGAAIDLGVGYMKFWGTGDFHADSSMQVSPDLFVGGALSTGVRNQASGNGVTGSLTPNAFIGFRTVALSGGYDVVAKSWVFGLATKLDLLSFRPNTGASLCVEQGSLDGGH